MMKLSELLQGALEELDKFEAADNTGVNMKYFLHTPESGVCFACLGGIWALKQAGVTNFRNSRVVSGRYHSYLRDPRHGEVRRQESALDDLRTGDLDQAFYALHGRDATAEELPQDRFDITPYAENPNQFKADMQKLAQYLKEIGL